MEIIVNGERHALDNATNVAELVAGFGINTQKMAIEINGAIVPRSCYEQTAIAAGDRIEMVRFIGGG